MIYLRRIIIIETSFRSILNKSSLTECTRSIHDWGRKSTRRNGGLIAGSLSGVFTGEIAPGLAASAWATALAVPAALGIFAPNAPSWTKTWAQGYAVVGAVGNLVKSGLWLSEMNGYEAAINSSVANEGLPSGEQADLMSFVNAGKRIGDFMLFTAGLSLIPLGM